MKVWVSRDESGYNANNIAIWKEKPYKDLGGSWLHKNVMKYLLVILCRTEYRLLFSFTPRKGSCKQYEITMKESTQQKQSNV